MAGCFLTINVYINLNSIILKIYLKGGKFVSLACLLCLAWASKMAKVTVCFKLAAFMALSPRSIPTLSW